MRKMTIRLAESADEPQVLACVEAAYQGYVATIGAKPAPMLDDYGSLIRASAVWVAMDGAELLGAIVMWARPDHWYVDNVAVWPAMQGEGVGSLLLVEAEHAATSSGFGEIRLYTNEAMTANTTYYERRGYQETHRAEQDGYRRIFYTRQLT